MIRILFLFIFINLLIPLNAKNVIIEVSNKYPMTEVRTCKIKMPRIKDAFDYCNSYKGNQGIEIVLKDDVNVIDSSLVLNRTSVPITIKAKRGFSVITSGRIADINVKQNGDTILFPLKSQCRKLLVNGQNVDIANTFTPMEPMRELPEIKKITDYLYTAKLSKEEIRQLEEGCDIFIYTRWQCYKLQVKTIDRSTNCITLSTMGKKAFYITDKGVRYTIYNSRYVMQPGTFCWKNGTIYYLKRKNENISNIRFSIPTVATLVRVYDCKNITFRNISFENAVLDDWYFQEVQGSALCSKAVHVEYSSMVVFMNCDFHNNMGYSLAIGNHSFNCIIRGCCFSDLQGGGVILGMEGGDGTNNISISDNLIKGYGRINVCCEAILSQRAHHISITNNTICDGFYTGINLGWTWGYDKSFSYGNYVANNHVHHLMQGVLDDGGGIYTLGAQNGTIIENNCIHDIYPDKEMACLIYLDEGSSDLTIRNNICYASKRGISESYGRNNIVQNNVIGNVDKWGLRLSYPKKDQNLRIIGNMIFADEDMAIDDNIPKESLNDNVVLPVKDASFKNKDLVALYKERLINIIIDYGCRSKRLKNIEEIN